MFVGCYGHQKVKNGQKRVQNRKKLLLRFFGTPCESEQKFNIITQQQWHCNSDYIVRTIHPTRTARILNNIMTKYQTPAEVDALQ